ncbi:hypothetical protein ACU4GD_15610 [Cupriavidus basilensis]
MPDTLTPTGAAIKLRRSHINHRSTYAATAVERARMLRSCSSEADARKSDAKARRRSKPIRPIWAELACRYASRKASHHRQWGARNAAKAEPAISGRQHGRQIGLAACGPVQRDELMQALSASGAWTMPRPCC